jgi:DNA transformation protein
LKKNRDTFRDYVSEQLGLDVLIRPMFGGYGLYRDDRFFGIVFQGRLYFRTGPLSRKKYLERAMKPFKPRARWTSKTYFEVPADVLEDRDTLRDWALEAAR